MRWQGLVTGLAWRRLPKSCPPWCGGKHYCTARDKIRYPSGEHRSVPIRVEVPYGLIVVTRVQRIDGASWLEPRIRVGLPSDDEAAAGQQAVLVMDEIDQAIRMALAAFAPGPWIEAEQWPALTSA